VTAVLTEPGTAKAAAMAPGGELTYFSFPVTKTEESGDGTLKLWGRATDGSLDSDLQIVDPEWSAKALQEWYETGANVRVQHQAQRDPAGKGFEVRGHDIGVTVVEPVAVRLVKAGVLQDFSVGIINPDIRRGDPALKHLDPHGKAVNGIITGRADGLSKIGEVSLVDRGSNFGTRFAVVKAAADGTPRYVGELTAPDEVLAKVAEPKSKTVTVELPKNMSLSVKPSDLAKLATFGQKIRQDEAAVRTAAAEVTKTAEPDADGPELTAVKAAEAPVLKRDIDTATRRRLAGEGNALPNLSYPIENAEDLRNAAHLARSGHGDVAAAKRLIARRARELGVPNPLKGSKKTKAAQPQVTKCGSCDGSGMAGGKPCTECKKGRKKARGIEKAAARAALAAVSPQVTKKSKVLCGGCGARQNRKHAMCSECGKPMAGAMPVTKNHDFTCLGCGGDLDKGEKHCPSCGKENPGYNPMADQKIPANAGKAAEERVTKRKKRKKAKPGKTDGDGAFGGHQAPPSGAGAGGGGGKKPASKKSAKPQAAKRKGKGKGRSPAAGVTGEHGTAGLPAHREPDGAPVEMFEDDAHLQDGDERQEMAAAMRHKALAVKGLSRDDALLHDLTCPAFRPADVTKAFPFASLADTDAARWQDRALKTAAAAPLDQAMALRDLAGYAAVLKDASPGLLADLREESHQAFLKANQAALKALLDAAPGPGSFPSPGHVSPRQFRRPYIREGRAAASPQQGPPRGFAEPGEAPGAEHFTRPLITAGHGADAPQNDSPRAEHIQPPAMTGRPQRVYYTGAMRDNARQAMTAMHDHIARVFPDVCPMSPQLDDIQKPAPEVPGGVGGPVPHRGKSRKAAKAKIRKRRKAVARRRRRLERQVLTGKISVSKGRRKLGLAPVPEPEVTKAEGPAGGALDAEALKAVLAEATAPLLERVAAQDKTLRRQRKAISKIAGQPDTSHAPSRGAAVIKTSAAPAGPLTASSAAEQIQLAELQRLRWTSLNSPDPGLREAARRDLDKKLGLTP
jgi:hypothetical protein